MSLAILKDIQKRNKASESLKRMLKRRMKKSRPIINLKQHHRKISLECLFQVESRSSRLHIFCIPKEELKTYEVDFTFPPRMGLWRTILCCWRKKFTIILYPI